MACVILGGAEDGPFKLRTTNCGSLICDCGKKANYMVAFDDSTQGSSRGQFLTVLALSIHAIFEGMAVGLETSVNAVWTIYAGN